jgi:hypothetical protein
VAAIDAGLRDESSYTRFWCVFAAGQFDLQELRPQIETMVSDTGASEMNWTVGDEVRDVLTSFDGEVPPERS